MKWLLWALVIPAMLLAAVALVMGAISWIAEQAGLALAWPIWRIGTSLRRLRNAEGLTP